MTTINTTNTTIIRRSATSPTGYELVVNGVATPIDQKLPTKKGDDFSLVLPENPTNRRYFTVGKVEKAGGEVELTEKEAPTQRGESTPRKGLEEYLEGEDRETYLRLVEKAKANRDAQKSKPKTKAELEALLEQALAELAQMKGKGEA